MPPYVPLEQRQRIVELSLQGWSQRAICRLMNRSRAAVSRIIRTYRDHGGSLADRERSGRPGATDTETDSLIVACVVVDPFIDAKEIRRELQLDVSLSTIRRRLREAGLRGCVAAQKPQLTERQRQLRLEFARSVEGCTVEEWGEVIFTDESTFSSRWDQQRHVWRPMNCRYLPEYCHNVLSSGRCAVSAWGAISKEGLCPLVRINGSFTASAYCRLLQEVLVPYALEGPFEDGCYQLQHDRSPIHTARMVATVLENLAIRTLPWPPVGADLNPIENVWGIVKSRLSARRLSSATSEALWQAVSEEWERLRLTPEVVVRLYESMPRRVQAVIAANGNLTRY
ncbi:hypothetical protein HPB52_010877 [Rhipicephalus sanguineus]|uniref:Paired domain-containing protein n=1 Tax=Rhipicephalus sanguineus TaxID=34632 RepID=A0A9D4SWH2_RHISA|nr:hypothetical protein HPB52_010877 [Rhipicephalus sanguineus]